ncbi:MAG: hypothetical protein IPG22_16630 [Acidobacteria bacterium]|nr:hypothetical protein [Acidobacteriota bacterium]
MKEFLDNAVYPIRHAAGLTFGYSSTPATASNAVNNWAHVVKGTPSGAGDVTKITAYVGNNSARLFKGGLWRASDNVLIGTTNSASVPSGYAWTDATFGTSQSVTAVAYLVGFIPDGSISGGGYYDAGSTGDGGLDTGNSYTTPTNLTALGSTTRKYGAYATYDLAVQNYTLDLGGTITASGSIQRQVTLQKSGSVSAIGAALKSIARSFFGSITGTGATLRQGQLLRSGVATPSGLIVREAGKQVGGGITIGGSLKKDISVAYAGSSTPSGAAIREMQRTAAGSITPSGTLLKRGGQNISRADHTRVIGGETDHEGPRR